MILAIQHRHRQTFLLLVRRCREVLDDVDINGCGAVRKCEGIDGPRIMLKNLERPLSTRTSAVLYQHGHTNSKLSQDILSIHSSMGFRTIPTCSSKPHSEVVLERMPIDETCKKIREGRVGGNKTSSSSLPGPLGGVQGRGVVFNVSPVFPVRSGAAGFRPDDPDAPCRDWRAL